MKRLHIATSPLTDRIFCGHLLKTGGWAANKQEVTGDACAAVACHVLLKGGTITVSGNGEPLYEITVKALKTVAVQP